MRLCFSVVSILQHGSLLQTAQVTAKELAELRTFRNPPAVVCQVLEAHPTKCNLSAQQFFMLAVFAGCSFFKNGMLDILKQGSALFHFGRSLLGQTFALIARGITLRVQGSCLQIIKQIKCSPSQESIHVTTLLYGSGSVRNHFSNLNCQTLAGKRWT